ncbi:MAG: type II toxin-antitoxin system prevent-host-death family antitoxin [Rhodospirillaceae bacterium]|uniref:type II toxin-antitoxin system Phd/YefM family antitoxin n=1 Tax=Hwanghaeella sp. 1Z406 TaxID=3402811 RepID=UPI000C5F0FDB|nr:type II toxin-antitoxin system prevent-host-death family antitoxin [Rhodospirillales bacterium]MAX46623.1 type II toxin-antitoxin system prevent-host-death family antitoxin [Rhodospirillaceae bacterium]
MKTLSARDAKNRFGYLIDTARQEPVSVEKHGRPVVVVLSIEDYERLTNAAPRGSAGEPE